MLRRRPGPGWTPQVLALLRRYRAVATFCMVGERCGAHPELVAQVVKAGMRLCDHSRTHPVSLVAMAEDAARRDRRRPRRPGRRDQGGGAATSGARRELVTRGHSIAAKKKMQPLGWSVDPRDWSLPGAPAIVSRVQEPRRPGRDRADARRRRPAPADRGGTGRLLPWLVELGAEPAELPEFGLESLARTVGGEQALSDLDVTPLPVEDFAWDTVPPDVHDRVREVLELVDDCCAALLDKECRTACHRLLSRAAAADPDIFRRRGRADTAAAAVCWVIGKANALFDPRSVPHLGQGPGAHFGLARAPSRAQRALPAGGRGEPGRHTAAWTWAPPTT